MKPSSAPPPRTGTATTHTPGGYGGVPQKVGKEFNAADKGTGIGRMNKGFRGRGNGTATRRRVGA